MIETTHDLFDRLDQVVASIEIERFALFETSAQRASRVFANASNRPKSLLEALAEARTIAPVLSPEPTIRRDL